MVYSFKCFFERNINFVHQLLDKNDVVKNCEVLKAEMKLESKDCFQWIQILHALARSWKQNLKQFPINYNYI